MFNRGLGKKEKASIIFLQEKTRTVRSFSVGSGEKDELRENCRKQMCFTVGRELLVLTRVLLGTGGLRESAMTLVCSSQRVRLTSHQRHQQGLEIKQRVSVSLLIPECWLFQTQIREARPSSQQEV